MYKRQALRAALGPALERDLLDELALARISRTWSERGEAGIALAWARAATASFPDSCVAWEIEAEAWTARGDADRAREAWRRVQERDPDSQSARKALAGR